MPRPYHPEDGRERVLYGFAQDNQCDSHKDEDDAEGFLPGKGFAEDKGTHTYGRHRLHGSQDGRQRAAYVVYGQHQGDVRDDRRHHGQQYQVGGRQGVGNGLDAFIQRGFGGYQYRGEDEDIESQLAPVHVLHARLVHRCDVARVTHGREQHDDHPRGVEHQLSALQRQLGHAVDGQHDGRPRHPRRPLLEEHQHQQRDEDGIGKMQRRGHSRSHVVVPQEQALRGGHVEKGQQQQDRQVPPFDAERLLVQLHHPRQGQGGKEEAVEEDGVERHAFLHQGHGEKRDEAERHRRGQPVEETFQSVHGVSVCLFGVNSRKDK